MAHNHADTDICVLLSSQRNKDRNIIGSALQWVKHVCFVNLSLLKLKVNSILADLIERKQIEVILKEKDAKQPFFHVHDLFLFQ
jgi:hypothetical protein